jgi:hypothetical protein
MTKEQIGNAQLTYQRLKEELGNVQLTSQGIKEQLSNMQLTYQRQGAAVFWRH